MTLGEVKSWRGVLTNGLATLLLANALPANAAFERSAANPQTAALAEIASLADDPVFANPGALLRAQSWSLQASSDRPFGLADLRESQVSGFFPVERLRIGFGARQLGHPEYFEREGRVTCAAFLLGRGATPRFSLGGAARLLSVGGASFSMATRGALDLGACVEIDTFTTFGFVTECVVGAIPGDPAHRIPRTSLGFRRALPLSSAVLLEVARRNDREPRLAAGVTISPTTQITFLAGVRDEPRVLSWGIVVKHLPGVVSLAISETENLGRTLRVGVGFSPRIAQESEFLADP